MFTRSLSLLVAGLLSLSIAPAAFAATPAASSDLAASSPRTTVLFVGGYGSTLSKTESDFSPVQSALQSLNSHLTFTDYSYTGWNAETCTPLDYQPTDTGQDFETSKQLLLTTIATIRAHCGAQRIIIIGHSLGGLIALHALAEKPIAQVTDLVTVDSPLGGAPAVEIDTCVDAGLCVDGPVTDTLAGLYTSWDQTAADNADRVKRLAQAGTRVTAWGNQSDCLYAPAVCLPFARNFLSSYDVRETQWLGVDHAIRRDYAPKYALAGVLFSHDILLSMAANDMATDLLS
jgi:pimeloyl-ACP methyl ester carboxylesterase